MIDEQRLINLKLHWDTANFLSVGQIYLRSNSLLREPLKPEHIKKCLLGHWGTSPGLNLIYSHLNRLIQDTGAEFIYIAGPGHGGPALRANIWLDGCMSEIYPDLSMNMSGIDKLMKDFSWPGGVPSHVSPPTPGSIHEGGELGYSLVHAYGSVMDNPNLIAACVVGDGEAETGPLATSWHSNKFINPARDGAVLPILHMNGYKISGPTVFGRMEQYEAKQFFEGCGYQVRWIEGEDPDPVHHSLWETLDWAHGEIRRIQQDAKENGVKTHAKWPMIVLKTPKRWTGPKVVDGKKVEGTFRSHQVPISDVIDKPDHLKILSEWMISYKPDKLFGPDGVPIQEVLSLIPKKELRMGSIPYANGGLLLKELDLPDYTKDSLDVPSPSGVIAEATRETGKFLRDIFKANGNNFRIFCSDETNSNRLNNVFDVTNRMYLGEVFDYDNHLAADGRVMEVLSEHLCQGWLEGYLLTGRHGLFPCYEAFALIVNSMLNQQAKWLKACRELPWRKPVASLNYLLTSHAWRQDHNGYSHQGPRFIESVLGKKGTVARIYLPSDANCLLSTMDHCLRSKNYVNLIIAGKQPMFQWLNMKEAQAHCAKGASIWNFASDEGSPDVVMASAGDTPTLEILASITLLRHHFPDIKIRMVNIVDLLTLLPQKENPHGFDDETFAELFTENVLVIFAFHGHPRVIKELVYQRPAPHRFHVSGYIEEGTTTTPFDMVVCNEMSRYHLAMKAMTYTSRLTSAAGDFIAECQEKLKDHKTYIHERGEDMPEILNWRWSR